jgi:hypothetical protein
MVSSRFAATLAVATATIGLMAIGGVAQAVNSKTDSNSAANSVLLSEAKQQFVPTFRNACSDSQLVAVIGQTFGEAGIGYQNIIFVNDLTHSCWLKGYPKVTLENAGARIDTHSIHESEGLYANPLPRLVVLKPSEVATVGISYTDISVTPANGVPTVCSPFSSITIKWRGNEVEKSVVTLPDMISPCGGVFAVTAFEKGAQPKRG